jgi:outer membrane receptor for ferrienterochelin and colicin
MNKLYIIFIFLIITLSGLSQTGTIKGRIFDKTNNEPLPFSNIYIEGTNIGATSDYDGNFTIAAVKPGFYELTASSLGYEKKVTEEFRVLPDKSTFVNIEMRKTATQLEEVEVTASVFEKREDAPVSLRSIGISEIENAPGANRDIAKVIQNLPGVAAVPSANRNDLLIRGGAGNESKFYLDGIEIPNINHFATQGATGGTNGILNADFLREVNYYSSGFPASKANALSAVFNFKQIDGNKEEVKMRTTLGASELSLTADGPLGDKTTFIVSVRRSYLQLLFKALGLPFLPTFNDYQAKVKTKIDDKNELTLISLGALDNNRLDLDIDKPDEYQRYLLANLPEQDQWSYAIGGVWKHFRDNGYQTLVLSRNMLSNRSFKYQDNDRDNGTLIQDYNSTEAENKFRWENYTMTDFNLELTYGAGGQYVKYFNNTYQQVYVQDALTSIDYNSKLEFFKYAAFIQGTRGFMQNRLSLSAAFRLSGNTYGDYMHNPFKQSSPQLSASFFINDKFSLNAHVGRYYQLPPYTALGYRGNSGFLVNRENNLTYITADHYVAGIEYRPGKNNLITLEGFYKNYTNYPFSVTDSISLAHRRIDFGNVGTEALVSTSEGRAYGIELLSQNRFPGDITFVLSYTYAISEFKDKDGNYASTAWDNRHILVATASKSFKNNWYAGIKWRFAGGLPYTPYDLYLSSFRSAWDITNAPYLDYDRLTSERFAPFHQLDIRVDKSFYFKHTSLKVYVDIQNLYNFKSESRDIYTNLDADGNPIINPSDPSRYMLRTIRSGGSGTILPTIGIIFDF